MNMTKLTEMLRLSQLDSKIFHTCSFPDVLVSNSIHACHTYCWPKYSQLHHLQVSQLVPLPAYMPIMNNVNS